MPHTNVAEKKDQWINVRLTTRVMDRIQRVIERDGMNVGEFSRLAILRAVEEAERKR